MLLTLNILLIAENTRWGGTIHRYINYNAVDYLPNEMAFFAAQRQYFEDHASDPDYTYDPNPGYYHYIDIDYYYEFFNGTFPTDIDSLISLYDYSTVTQNGTIPWVIETWADSLTALMAEYRWTEAWQIAAELGHYVADSHQPLHLTLNYNGQLTGNYGIHSRYESTMMNTYSNQLILPQGEISYWDSVIDSVIGYITDIYPNVDRVIAADDKSAPLDPYYGSVYYASMWSELDSITNSIIQMAVLDLASIWYTSWVNAGQPAVSNAGNHSYPDELYLSQNYPNPFNSGTMIEFSLPAVSDANLVIYDLVGEIVAEYRYTNVASGRSRVSWNGRNSNGVQVSSGLYYYRLITDYGTISNKMMLIK